MDLKKELRELENNIDYSDKAINDILNEQKTLQKKLHLVRAIALANKFEKAVEDGIFNKPKVELIDFSFEYANDENYNIKFYFRNDKGNYISEYDYKTPYKKQIKFCQDLFSKIGTFEVNLTNRNKAKKEIELKPGIKDKFLDLLLCQELKKVYEYNRMEVDLPMNNIEQSTKLKI